MKSNKITFVIPSRNNLEFLQLAYQSIRNLETQHEILVLNDASTDGTQEWMESLGDEDLIIHHNPGPDRIGIVGMFDKGIEMAKTDIIMAFHSDMVAAPDLDKHILKHLEKGTVVSATRVEPPLHPDGPEKMLVDFGIEVEDFDMDKFNNWVINEYKPKHDTLITEGIFAPWCMYKEDFLAIGGHDELFAPQSKEDSDIFNRFVLNGYKVLQTWEGLVYHFTSRGSRFNKHAGGGAGLNSQEWLYTTTKNMRNFIRKWGTMVKHDSFMKPIISPKYDIGLIISNSSTELVRALEPWCSTIYTDSDIMEYITLEQSNTSIDLKDRVKPYDNEKNNQILIELKAQNFNQQDFEYLNQLPNILKDSGAIGEFQLGNLKITIIALDTFEQKLIKNDD
jgi:glycosyltransferase involved in cell wall biosynthesis|tara:strand:+ start:455 stop:1633 length:1179 start_codon:yes stop_codon:yes gene_type:complete